MSHPLHHILDSTCSSTILHKTFSASFTHLNTSTSDHSSSFRLIPTLPLSTSQLYRNNITKSAKSIVSRPVLTDRLFTAKQYRPVTLRNQRTGPRIASVRALRLKSISCIELCLYTYIECRDYMGDRGAVNSCWRRFYRMVGRTAVQALKD